MRNEFICGLYSLKDLDEISLTIKNEVSNLARRYRSLLANRYNNDVEFEVNINYIIEKLHTYYDIIRRLKERVLQGSDNCLERVELQCLIEKITDIVGKNCNPETCDIMIDNSREEEWVVKKPFCRSYEDWEKWSKFICGKLNLEVKSETETVNKLILEITQEIITPNVLLAISAYSEVRENLKLEIKRNDEEIKLDFELLMEKVPSCDLNLELYSSLVKDFKLSFDIIKTVYDSDLSLDLLNESVQLKTPVNAYTLEEISGEVNIEYLEKFGIKPTINKNDLLQDYK